MLIRPSELEELPDVFNDLDVDFTLNPAAARAYLNDSRNQRKIREVTRKLELNIMNPPRLGKKLLVLDLDYSPSTVYFLQLLADLYASTAIVDTKPLLEGSLPPPECARPRLHEFLEAVYPHYDICIWQVPSPNHSS